MKIWVQKLSFTFVRLFQIFAYTLRVWNWISHAKYWKSQTWLKTYCCLRKLHFTCVWLWRNFYAKFVFRNSLALETKCSHACGEIVFHTRVIFDEIFSWALRWKQSVHTRVEKSCFTRVWLLTKFIILNFFFYESFAGNKVFTRVWRYRVSHACDFWRNFSF